MSWLNQSVCIGDGARTTSTNNVLLLPLLPTRYQESFYGIIRVRRAVTSGLELNAESSLPTSVSTVRRDGC